MYFGLDIVFLLDGSGSVDPKDFRKMKAFVENFIEKFITKNTQVSIIHELIVQQEYKNNRRQYLWYDNGSL